MSLVVDDRATSADQAWAEQLLEDLKRVHRVDESGAWRSQSPVAGVERIGLSLVPGGVGISVMVSKTLGGETLSYEIHLTPDAIASSSVWAPVHRGLPLRRIPVRSIALVVAIHMIDEPLGAEFIQQRDGRNFFVF